MQHKSFMNFVIRKQIGRVKKNHKKIACSILSQISRNYRIRQHMQHAQPSWSVALSIQVYATQSNLRLQQA